MINALRYLGFHDMVEIERMTLAEYKLRMRAYRLHRLDEEYMIAYAAWMNREVNAQKKKGKGREYVYRKFSSFFNFEEMEDQIMGRVKIEDTSTAQGRYIEFMRKKGQQNG